MSNATESLYAAWKKIYPRYQLGFFRTLRSSLYTAQLVIFFFLPFLRWERPSGLPNQAILFDLPGRKFYIFDLMIWPQDIILLAFLLMAAALGLFFITALGGRVFCGYMCIQTVWTDLLLHVELLFEGNRKQRIKFDHSPLSVKKFLIKGGKHFTWLLISAATGVAFVNYFMDAPTFWRQLFTGELPTPALLTVAFLTATTYLMAGLAREQVCIYMCPYARFQGAMFDDDTMIVAYHPEIGEPRESNRRIRTGKTEQGERVGECIDCDACVTVCPTGIDIRNGQQYECITCAACIDACDSVRERLHASKRTLICYTSLREMGGEKTRWLRPRILYYAVLLSLFFGGMAYYLNHHAAVELTVIAHRQPMYIVQSDGGIQNNYTMRVLNMTTAPQTYSLAVDGVPEAVLSIAAIQQHDSDGHPLLTLEPGSVTPFTVYLRQPGTRIESGSLQVTFTLSALSASGGTASYHSTFVRPQ
ncbi:MAG: cytochrome c oxidase accessory protein CcoG [Magnetococcales bacterium]|nr:cytochrome c oxidase accessory protein CcoG [Magnetococcales bacterium]MBF0113796.1 cytochrome c oxidase accessory protein CcoG [Magnetococcales bacterium]